MTQAQDYVIDTGHGQVAEGVCLMIWWSCGGEWRRVGGLWWACGPVYPTGQLITGAGL